eukprot:g2579.t1
MDEKLETEEKVEVDIEANNDPDDADTKEPGPDTKSPEDGNDREDPTRKVVCCVIKPDATRTIKTMVSEGSGVTEKEIRPWEEIKSAIAARGFVLLAERQVTFTKDDMEVLYAPLSGEDAEQLLPHMTNGTSTILALERVDALRELTGLMGPEDPKEAATVDPSSLRARFGKDVVENAIVGSKSEEAAAREIRHWFPEGLPVQQTLAVVKTVGDLARARREGFRVIASRTLTKGDGIAAVLAKPGAIEHFRGLNLGKGSASADDAAREIREIFPTVSRRHVVNANEARNYLNAVNATVVKGCVELCKVKPVGADAVRWLGEWFLAEAARKSGGGAVLTEKETAATTTTTKTTTTTTTTSAAKIRADVSKARVVFVLGGPASGKTSMCAHIASTFGYQVLTPSGTETADMIESLRSAIEVASTNKFVVDGFPLQLSQAFAFEQAICRPERVVHLDCSESAMASRLGELDDEMIADKLAVYRDFCRPVVGLYEKLGAVCRVNAETGGLAAVAKRVANTFTKRVVFVPSKTDASRLAARGFDVLDIQALIAQEIAEGSPKGCELDDLIESGQLISDTLKISLLENALKETRSHTVVVVSPSLSSSSSSDNSSSGTYVTASESDIARSKVFFVIGPPGAKATELCVRISRSHEDTTHLNVGALIRAEIVRGSSVGKELDALVRAGKSVPAEKTMSLIRTWFSSKMWTGANVLVDGWPHTIEHASAFEREICGPTRVVLLKEEDEAALRRRAEMDDERFDRRMKTFVSDTRRVVRRYALRGVVDGVDVADNEDEVVAAIRRCVEDVCATKKRPKATLVVGGADDLKEDVVAFLGGNAAFAHVDVGEAFAQEPALEKYRSQKRSGPLDVAIPLVERAVQNAGRRQVLLSGYPRKIGNAYPLVHDQAFAIDEIVEVERVLVLGDAEADSEVLHFYRDRAGVPVVKCASVEDVGRVVMGEGG